jgi:hypothetical protein
VIFIEMESNLRPWSPFAHKMATLVRMCMRCNKILLASSAAMQVLIYSVASNFESVPVPNRNIEHHYSQWCQWEPIR